MVTLKPGWSAKADEATGKDFYWNDQTHESSWDINTAILLPPNWEVKFDETGHMYYWNVATEEASWEAPVDSGLPEGWEAKHTDDGDIYYWNDSTQESSWEKPAKSAEHHAPAAGHHEPAHPPAGHHEPVHHEPAHPPAGHHAPAHHEPAHPPTAGHHQPAHHDAAHPVKQDAHHAAPAHGGAHPPSGHAPAHPPSGHGQHKPAAAHAPSGPPPETVPVLGSIVNSLDSFFSGPRTEEEKKEAAKAEAMEKEKDEFSTKLPGLKDQLAKTQATKSEVRGKLGLKDGVASDDPELVKLREREIMLLDKICDMERVVEGEKTPGMLSLFASSVRSVAESASAVASDISESFVKHAEVGYIRHRNSGYFIVPNGSAHDGAGLILKKIEKRKLGSENEWILSEGVWTHKQSALGVRVANATMPKLSNLILNVQSDANSWEVSISEITESKLSLIVQPLGGDAEDGVPLVLGPIAPGSDLFKFDILSHEELNEEIKFEAKQSAPAHGGAHASGHDSHATPSHGGGHAPAHGGGHAPAHGGNDAHAAPAHGGGHAAPSHAAPAHAAPAHGTGHAPATHH